MSNLKSLSENPNFNTLQQELINGANESPQTEEPRDKQATSRNESENEAALAVKPAQEPETQEVKSENAGTPTDSAVVEADTSQAAEDKLGFKILEEYCPNTICNSKLIRTRDGEVQCTGCGQVPPVKERQRSSSVSAAEEENAEGDGTNEEGWTLLNASCPTCYGRLIRLGEGTPVCLSCVANQSDDNETKEEGFSINRTEGGMKRSHSKTDTTVEKNKRSKLKEEDGKASVTETPTRHRHYVHRTIDPLQQAINAAFGGATSASKRRTRPPHRPHPQRKLGVQSKPAVPELTTQFTTLSFDQDGKVFEPPDTREVRFETTEPLDPIGGAIHALTAKMEWSRQQLENSDDVNHCLQVTKLITSVASALTSIKKLQKT